MKEFFKLLLPEAGYKFVVWIRAGAAVHYACTGYDEMVQRAAALSAEGVDVYFSCASFAAPEYLDTAGKRRARTRENAVAAKSFWLDIDVGEHKAYSTQTQALRALAEFCRSHGLPKPMLVSSGAGLHCYWPMTEVVPSGEWQAVASKLKALTKDARCPLLVDHSRTSDIASVLRPIKTFNFKRDPAGEPVQLLKLVQAIAAAEFRTAVSAAYAKIAPALSSTSASPRRRAGAQADVAEIEEALHYVDPDGGDRSDWWTVLAALAEEFGEQARDLARRWSRGDLKDKPSARYDPDDFNAQFDDCLSRRGSDADRVTAGTIVWLARQGGYRGGTPDWVHHLNERYAWIEKSSAIYRLKFGDFIRPAEFRQQLGNQYVEVPSGDGRKRLPAGDAWLKHPKRRQHAALVMRPLANPVTDDNCLNVWQGFELEPAPGDTAPFFELFNRLIPDPGAASYALCWLAHLLQRPHVKMKVALVIWSRMQGVGKNLLFECISQIIGRHHSTMIGQAELARDFNGWARDKILIIGDEVIGDDRRQYADKLKTLITGTSIQINEKHQPAVELENLANFIFLSNHPTALFVGDDDRRYFVWEIEAGCLSADQSSTFASWRDNGGLAALLDHLLSIDLTSFNPHAAAPSTAAKRMMIEANRSDFEVWAEQLVSSGARNLLGRELATAAELANCYNQATAGRVSTKTVTATFKRLGAVQREHQVRVDTLKLRPIAIDRPEHWRNEPESSWGAEMRKPLFWQAPLGSPQQCLTPVSKQLSEISVLPQTRAA